MKHLREADTITRHGGDEFVLLLPELRNASDAVTCLREAAERARRTGRADGRELRISASMGIAMFPDDGELGDQLLQKADVALYKAKNAGRRNFCFFSESMNVSLNNKLELDARLADAAKRRDPPVVPAPVRSAQRQALWRRGADALDPADGKLHCARPVHSGCRRVRPHPCAWRLGLAEACAQSLRWAQIAGRPIPVAVNLGGPVPPRRPHREHLAHLADTGLPASSLVLEITGVGDHGGCRIHADRPVGTVGSLGLKLAIDDFGTGYSSLAYLKKPVSHLKIDRASSSRTWAVDPDDEIIVRTIIQLGHSLELEIVAEGSKPKTQIDLFTQHGCEYAQGYHYSRPLPAERFAAPLAPQDVANATWMNNIR